MPLEKKEEANRAKLRLAGEEPSDHMVSTTVISSRCGGVGGGEARGRRYD